MKVSVIIPVYNEEESIISCLKSLGVQSFKNFEVILVDDGSTDDTVKIVSKYLLKNKQLRILRQNHKGAGAARNLGVTASKGEILVFVDADMTFDKDFLKLLVKPIEDGKAVGTFSKEEYLQNKDNIWAVCWNINRGLPGNKMHPEGFPDTQKVFRAILKSEFNTTKGFDEHAGYTDDTGLSDALGKKAVAAPGAYFYHRNPDNLYEVFRQSKWMAKRKYKGGFFGTAFALLRVTLPSSVISGLVKAISIYNFNFLIFKIISDFGQFLGIIEYNLFHVGSK